MDIGTVVGMLAPMMPSIMDYAKVAGGKLMDTLMDAGLQKLLVPKIEASPAAKEAAADLAQTPDDADTQAAMRIQLKKILDKNPEFLVELQAILAKEKPAGSTVYNSQTMGEKSPILNDVSGSIFNFS